MAEKLFYRDACLRTFSAQVLGCEADGKRWRVVLDQTAFYPEGGGQPGDTGLLGGVRVADTQEVGGEVVHFCEAPLAVGSSVQGELDWARRFDFMQQHSGEHIVSGLVYRKFGYHNVGFHMGAETVTVDLSGVLTEQELAQIERSANEIVWADVPVEARYPDERELAQTDFRSKKELHGWVRLIDIPGADLCACCGMHVARSGAIGLIKILSVQRFHEGVRLEMVSGRRAYDYVNLNVAQNRSVSQLLSAPVPETAEHVQRLLQEKAQLSYRLTGLENARLEEKAQRAAGQNPALLVEQGLDADGVRKLCTRLLERAPGVCAVFSGDDENGYKYAVGRFSPEQVKQMNAALAGRGGGKPGFAQGSVAANGAQIRAWFAEHCA